MTQSSPKIFKLGADEIEAKLAASIFEPRSGNVDLALECVSDFLASDLVFESSGLKRGLEILLSGNHVANARDALLLLRNIRRWAIDGLRDDELLSSLEHRLVAPYPTAVEGDSPSAGRARASRSITAKQARAVLANAFLGNVNDPMACHKDSRNRGGLDFRKMLSTYDTRGNKVGLSKMECLVVYFQACSLLEGTADDDRLISFDLIRFIPLTSEAFGDLGETRIVGEGVDLHTGTMESPPRETSAFVNFANPNYGYGKFITSCTQEEILLMCCPELIVGMIFIGKMKDSEVVNVRGVRRFCRYSGYLKSFQCEGMLPMEVGKQDITTVLTLDACFRDHFSEAMLWRDVSKAYFSFLELASTSEGDARPTVSTGKWGCGAFGGAPAHKMLQQAVAAAAAGVDLEFSAFGSLDRCDEVIAALHESKPSVGRVVSILQNSKIQTTFVEHVVKCLLGEDSLQKKQYSWTNLFGLV